MKKIIALAVASAFIVPAAMAEVTVYGSLRTAVEYSKQSNTVGQNYSKLRLADQSSRLGFKGSDKLDNGLTVLWQAEQRVRVGSSNADGTNNASVGWGDRATLIGLQGDFGLVRAGKYDDIIDESRGDFFGALGSLDETSSVSGNFVRRGAAKSVNTIAYTSPSFGGFGFKAQYAIGEKTATTNNNGYAATAFYKAKMFEVGAGYKGMSDTTSNAAGTGGTDGNKYKYYVVGGSVMPIAGLKISAAWDQVKTTAASVETKQAGYGIGVQYDMGKYSFEGSLSQLADKKVAGVKQQNTSPWGAGLGMSYALSKQTQLLAGASYIKNDSGSSIGGSNGSFTGIAGAKYSSVSVGLKTTF